MSAAAVRPVTIKHKGTPEQLAFWQSPKKFRAFIGGIGSGKTRAGCVEVLHQPAGSAGMIVAPTYQMLRDSTLDSFLRLFLPLVKDFNRNEMRMELSNGTTILWRSADNPDSLRGPNLGWVWADEAALLPEQVWDILIGRLRLAPGRGWVTTTPKGFGWLYRVFDEQRRDDYQLIRCSTRANFFLPAGYVDALEAKYEGAWAAQELAGEFVSWVDTPCYTFRREINVAPCRQMYRPDLPLVLAMDFNVRYMAWPVGQVIKGRPYVIGEIVQRRQATVAEGVRLFRNAFPDHPGEVHVYGDAAGHTRTAQTGRTDYDLILDALKGYPSRVVINAPGKNPAPRDRINAVNRVLTDPEIRLTIDPTCSEGIADLIQVEWDKTGSREQQYADPEDERNVRTHWTSGLGYWLWREFPVAAVTAISKMRKPLKHKSFIGGLE